MWIKIQENHNRVFSRHGKRRNIVAGFYLGSNLNGIGFESQVVHGSKGRALLAHVVSYLDSGIDSCSIRSKIEGLPDLQP